MKNAFSIIFGLFMFIAILYAMDSNQLTTQETIYIQVNNNDVVVNTSSPNVHIEEIESQDNTKKYKIICAAGTTIVTAAIAATVTLVIHFTK